MRIFICVDDTDDLTKETSTGSIADMICQQTCLLGGEMICGITRHQLLLHEDIDYTSHNSSMCMEIELQDNIELEEVKKAAEKILKDNMSTKSDPGLCFCILDNLEKPEKLISYGKKAQKEVLSKASAYEIAKECNLILNEYGGTGGGVIGAVAGIGLRLYGNDGTLRGDKGKKWAGQSKTAAEWKSLLGAEVVLDLNGNPIEDQTQIDFKKRMKLAYIDHKATLVVKKDDERYYVCEKNDIYLDDKPVMDGERGCEKFEKDNDLEECIDDREGNCFNCLFRRWTEKGFVCQK